MTNIQTLQPALSWTPTPKSQCFNARVSKSDFGGLIISSELKHLIHGEGVELDGKGLNISSIYGSLCMYVHTYIHTLHYITLHYITLHYITLHYITLHYITLHYITYIHIYIYTYIHIYIYNVFLFICVYVCVLNQTGISNGFRLRLAPKLV